MSLHQKISSMEKEFFQQAPEAVRTMMVAAMEGLKRAGIDKNSFRKGDRAPDFTLPDGDGTMVSSVELLAKGPLVVSFYRGGW